MATEPGTGESLERNLEQLLEQERFEPPQEFVENALLNDPKVYEEAEADPDGWWAKQAEELHWFEKWERVLDWDDAPFAKWFVGGKLNVSYNCLDRHVEAGLGDRVAFHWRGEEGQERDVTYAELLRDTQRLANALKDHGIEKGDVVGIFMPMIPEVAVAMFEGGKNVKQVQEWLGHARPGFTLDTYVHLMDDGLGDADFLDDAVGPAEGASCGGNGWATHPPHTAAKQEWP